ncbi:MAG: hypothetical protein EA361_00140 [Bacteroidetes bacterium]|nr:MAG: hypothetical protein EA361_00140 [Bacteroidota bacterium]
MLQCFIFTSEKGTRMFVQPFVVLMAKISQINIRVLSETLKCLPQKTHIRIWSFGEIYLDK